MGTLNDEIIQELVDEVPGEAIHHEDLWAAFLNIVNSGFVGWNDSLAVYLSALGFSTGSINDRLMAYLGSLGYTGTLNDRLMQAALDGTLFGEGIPYQLIIYGDAINPAWEAVEVTALDPDDSVTPISGYGAIGDQYTSAYVTGFGSNNLLTFPIRADLTDAQRTFTVAPWLKGLPQGPYIHVLDVSRQDCPSSVVEATVPQEYGAAQVLTFDGSTTLTYDLTNLSYDVNEEGESCCFLISCRWAALNAAETVFCLYSSVDPTDFIEIAKLANNNIRASVFVNGVLQGAGVLSGHDFDTNGGINTDGWVALTLLRGATTLQYKVRSFFNANNPVEATGNIPEANIDTEWANPIDRIRFGARPDGTQPFTGRVNKFTGFKGIGTDVVADVTADVWNAVRENGADSYTQYQRTMRVFDLTPRTPWTYRNRANGMTYLSSTGTPAVTTTGAVDIPVDCKWQAMWQSLTVPAGILVQYYIPESDGMYLFMTGEGHDSENITITFDEEDDSSQVINGPRAVIAGGGATIEINSDASAAFAGWLCPLLGDEGP